MSVFSSLLKLTAGALVGGAIGAVVGMLLAPRSGEETRHLIREEFEDRYRNSRNRIQETAREKAEFLKGRATIIRDKMSEISTDLEATGRKAMGCLNEVRETVLQAATNNPPDNYSADHSINQ